MINTTNSNKLEPAFSTSTDSNDNLIIAIYVPGLDKKDIKLRKMKQVLTITFDRVKPEKVEFSDCTIAYGEFGKSFTVPDVFDLNKLNTTVENGVLTIKIAPDSDQVQTISL